MNYLEIVNLTREPFSNSPDPESFYPAEPHQLCLNRLEIAIRLKRGLNIVYGPVGSGKSTLCRALFSRLKASPDMRPGLLLDAEGGDVLAFVKKLLELMGEEALDTVETPEAGIGRLESLIFDMALKEGITPVLLLDEGQKLSPGALEVLRVLLNFETNTEKLIQIVIFAQPEFHDTVAAMENFADRVNEEIRLRPMSEEESVEMLSHRLLLAGAENPERLFDKGALREIHHLTGGYPRKMIRLAHLTLLALIMSGRKTADARLVKDQFVRMQSGGEEAEKKRSKAPRIALVVAICAAVAAAATWNFRDELKPVLRPILRPIVASMRPYINGLLSTASEKTPVATNAPAGDPLQSPQNASQTPNLVPGTAESEPQKAEIAPALGQGAVPRTAQTPNEISSAVGAKVTQEAVATNIAASTDMPAAREEHSPAAPLPSQIVINMLDHPTLEEAAERFYSDPAAVSALRAANPNYEEDDGKNLLALPIIEYAVPETFEHNVLLAYGVYESAQDAYDAQERLALDAPKLEPRFAMRRAVDGSMRYCLLARASFRNASRAWGWLSARHTPDDIEPRILPPFVKGERALVMFPGAVRLSTGEASTVRLNEARR